MKKILTIISIIIITISCNNKENHKDINADKQNDYSIIGKKATITTPDGRKIYATYLTDSTLHWKTNDEKGSIIEDDEKMIYKKISDSIFFLNWIEKDGFTVSEILDSKNGTVKAFWSFTDEKSNRGKRTGMFENAKIEFEK